jgi:trk system potassium uptake protein TrkH
MRFDWAAMQRPGGGRRRMVGSLSGVRLFVVSFALLILVGAAGLLTLPGLYTGPRLGPIDALFTSASAVCVTGLVVADTARYFTWWGQAWILLLIQAGGLGILTFATLIIRLMGGRGGLGIETAAGAGVAARVGDVRAMVRAVVALTLAIEAVGAVGLWLLWSEPLGAGAAVWHAVFHAVSAFCNAGFSTFSDNLVGWQEDPPVLLTIGGLILLGGIGFLVLEDLRARFVRRTSRRLSTHSRIALAATAIIVVGAGTFFWAFESGHTLAAVSPVGRAVNAVFMAITPRTAGFNTIDYDRASNPAMMLTDALMFVGGSPGGTAGGVKTTTVSVLILLLIARLRARQHVSLGGRSVRDDTIQSAAGLVVGAITILSIAIFLLVLTEPVAAGNDRRDFARLVFEAFSAFGTVGLSMNKTTELTPVGRVLITLLMFVGRVGPLSLAAAMVLPRGHRAPFRYAYDNVVVG